MSVGGTLFTGSSQLWSGPLGVVRIGFEGYDLKKTVGDANLTPDQDVKDIMYQQDGTKAADHVRTGIDWVLNCVLGEISTGLITQIMAGVSTQNATPTEDSGLIDRSIYQSMLTAEAGALRVIAVDENGVDLTDLEHILNFYQAIPIISGELINWGADTQRNLPIEFRIKWYEFPTPPGSVLGAFGYWGDPTVEDTLALVWPDVEAPTLVTATADLATNMDVVFNENIAFQTAFDATHYVVKVNGAYEATATGGIISTTELALTFPASTFTAGDTIEVSISELALEDTETVANIYDGIDAQVVINTVP